MSDAGGRAAGRPVRCLILRECAVPPGDDWLAAEEAATLAALRVPKRRAEWRHGRWTAKRLLALALPDVESLRDVTVCAAPDGAPEALLGGAPCGWALSLAHRAGVAFCAAAPGRGPLGCDVERVEPRSDAFVSDYLTASEQRVVRGAPEAERALLANLVWSAKESALKALRVGLRADTRSVVVSLRSGAGDDGWRPLAVAVPGGAGSLHGWWRRDGGSVLTVVAAGDPLRPR